MGFWSGVKAKYKTHQTAVAMIMAVFLTLPVASWAADDTQTLRQQMEAMKKQMETLQKKLDQMETQTAKQAQDAQEIEERLNKAELHTATDKLSLGVEFRTRAESLHYDNILVAPESVTAGFFT